LSFLAGEQEKEATNLSLLIERLLMVVRRFGAWIVEITEFICVGIDSLRRDRNRDGAQIEVLSD
jgi:hypothetical protein